MIQIGLKVEKISYAEKARGQSKVDFKTYKPEYGVDIVRLPDGRLISPRRKEEVLRRRQLFSSKAQGLFTLNKLLKGLGSTMIPFTYLPLGSVNKIPDSQLMKILENEGTRILIRSDNIEKNSLISQWDRLLQPRAAFPNDAAGRREALKLIKDLNSHYSVIIHHTTRPISDAVGHGRIFVNPADKKLWVYYALRDKSTDTFSRWDHKLILVESKKAVLKNKPLSEKVLNECIEISKRMNSFAVESGLTNSMLTANFVLYKGEEIPEFFDLLLTRGMKKPDLKAF